MKLVSTALLAAGLAALSACGGGEEENSAANTASEDLYNVAPDDLGDENLLGNDLGNDLSLDNGAATEGGDLNASTENSTGNSQ
jgi:hypothetical protein